jgi:hypothetical protein
MNLSNNMVFHCGEKYGILVPFPKIIFETEVKTAKN